MSNKHPEYLDEAFEEVERELTQLFIRKYKDYGKGNIVEIGELGIAFRIIEKLSRLKNLLMQNKKPEFESLEETWKDIGVYAIIAILYKRSWFKKLELKEDR
ncbi:hypothetical protein HYT02_02260 [Candidatus Gottesmanbacteria bacterium]|nr:hypothetical protein [Candidatus Gottesmanbacteria bacterium]